ncbi:MAG: Fe-S cluster assembly protein SufD [Candidatus Neomarinimicrobiota bacterium]
MQANPYKIDFKKFMESDHATDFSNNDHRSKAFKRFLSGGFPTRKDEDWRFTDISELSQVHYQYSVDRSIRKPLIERELKRHLIPGCLPIVIYNGVIDKKHSAIKDLPPEIEINSRSDSSPAIFTMPFSQNNYFNNRLQGSAFYNWNTAFSDIGLQIEVNGNQFENDSFIQLLFISSPSARNTVYHYHNIFHVHQNSQLKILEYYLNTQNDDYLVNGVTEIIMDDNSSAQHILFQQDSNAAKHVHTNRIQQKKDSQLTSHQMNFGGKFNRNEQRILMEGPGGSISLYGLNLANAQQQMDSNIIVDHAQPHTSSRQIYKNILSDKAHGVFNGLVVVEKEAQHTDAKQTNRNLLMSDAALMNSNPQMEIYADDVLCAHGSTTGELDEDALYYIQTRGIDKATAINLLVKGFAAEVIDTITEAGIRSACTNLLDHYLAKNTAYNQ